MELRGDLELRREKLVTLLKNTKEMPLEKQHQLYGAIKELDQVLRLMSPENRVEEPAKTERQETLVITTEPQKRTVSVFKKVSERVRKLHVPIKVSFSNED